MQGLQPGSKAILVVDDDATVRGVLHTGLTGLGYDVEVAMNAAEARDRLRLRSYDAVLCDQEMPGGNGLELLAHVAEVRPDLPFIVLTGHADAPLASRAIRSGAVDYVSKPFEFGQLAQTIEKSCARQARDRARAAQLTDEILSGTIRALVAAVDAKDPHTRSHSVRVTALAMQFGRALGLAEDAIRLLEFASLLHDVGKIGVPERILLKPGRLDPEEWSIIKEHPVRSAEIVREVEPLAEVATVVRHHHERMNGTGYPDGLAGSAIPLLSRVIAIADAYEAMTADRAYRPAFSPEKARDIIHAEAGTHFDRSLCDVFLQLGNLP